MCLSLFVGPVPICQKKLVFLTQPLCQHSLLSREIRRMFSRGHLDQVGCFSTKLSAPHPGLGPLWQQAWSQTSYATVSQKPVNNITLKA